MNISQNPDVDVLKMSAVRTDEPQNTVIDNPSVKVKEEGSFSLAQTKDEIQNEELKSKIDELISSSSSVSNKKKKKTRIPISFRRHLNIVRI